MNFQAYSSFQKVVVIIIIINVAISFMAFGNFRTFEKLKFRIGDILGKNKEYYRLFTSAFVHGGYLHLAINMFVLHSFAAALEYKGVGILQFLIIYFVSLIIGNLLPLYIHRNNNDYSAVGASGAVSGVLYASIYLLPFHNLELYFIIKIPAWIFGILYLFYTVWAAKKGNDNIGHDAHFGGAVAGLLLIMYYFPDNMFINWKIILAMFIPIVYFLYDTFLTKKTGSNYSFTNIGTTTSNRKIDDLYNVNRKNKIIELNEILDKVREKGLENLTTLEKNRLESLSKELE